LWAEHLIEISRSINTSTLKASPQTCFSIDKGTQIATLTRPPESQYGEFEMERKDGQSIIDANKTELSQESRMIYDPLE
jgi:hypothetical protein